MKATEQESAVLKRAFKDHFAANGLNAPLPYELEKEAIAFPSEWNEAYSEFESDTIERL